jgi:DNA-binding protein Fis
MPRSISDAFRSDLFYRFEKSLVEAKKNHIMRVLYNIRGNQSKAADVLGINRRTLCNMIRKYDIFT